MIWPIQRTFLWEIYRFRQVERLSGKEGVRWLQMLPATMVLVAFWRMTGLGRALQTIASLTSRVTEDESCFDFSAVRFWSTTEWIQFTTVGFGCRSWFESESKRFFLKITKSMWLAMPPFVKTAGFIRDGFWFSLLRWSPGHEKCPDQDCSEFNQFVVPAVFFVKDTPIENHLGSCGLSSKLCFRALAVKEFMNYRLTEVAQFIKSFVMRRKKRVLTELPDLIEKSSIKMNWKTGRRPSI